MNSVINFIISNWYLIVAAVALIAFVVYLIMRFLHLPTAEQKQRVKEWLVWACIEAEHELKSGTGKAKLAKVYNAFISIPSFSWVAKVMTFENFSDLVDKALKTAKEMIINNEDLAQYVYGKSYKSEIAKLQEQLSVEE